MVGVILRLFFPSPRPFSPGAPTKTRQHYECIELLPCRPRRKEEGGGYCSKCATTNMCIPIYMRGSSLGGHDSFTWLSYIVRVTPHACARRLSLPALFQCSIVYGTCPWLHLQWVPLYVLPMVSFYVFLCIALPSRCVAVRLLFSALFGSRHTDNSLSPLLPLHQHVYAHRRRHMNVSRPISRVA